MPDQKTRPGSIGETKEAAETTDAEKALQEEIKADEGEIGLVGPNGNKIFFSVYGIYGNYWSSSLFDTQRAWYAEFRSIWNGPAASFYSKPRYDLLCIRAVVDRE